jgi:hypothetical protein
VLGWMLRIPLGCWLFCVLEGRPFWPDPFLTMEVLYQLSYVGANTNPSVVAADLDMIPARNDHKCPVGSGGVFVAVPGTFQGQNAREASPAPSRRALRTQSGRDLTDTEDVPVGVELW